MKNKKLLIFLIIIAIIGSGIYIYSSLQTVKAYTYLVPRWNLEDKISSLKNFVGLKVKENINKGEFLIKEKTQEAKTSIFEDLKDSISGQIDILGGKFGVASNSSFDLVINQVVKINQPIYFSIKNSDGKISYEINWGDEKIERGEIAENERKIVSHTWTKIGEYNITFKAIINGKDIKQQKIITVIE
ncbi:MAG: PKD domain-containing protein [Patescibacteria group bacterium]